MVASRPAAVEQAVLAPPSKPVPKQSQTAQATPAKWHPPQPQPPSNAKDRSQPYASKGFDWPVRGRILSNYGAKESGLHNDGVNIQGALGAPVMAADAGQVMYVGNALKGFGNLILIKHDNGWVSAYGHLNDTRVARGDYLDRGDIIGSIGQSGRVDSPQLHFEIRKGAEAIDPEQKLPKI